jgi:hypothetical protein
LNVRRHLSYANVAATTALFVALGGGAYAAGLVGPDDIRENAVRSVHVKRNTLTKSDIREATLAKVPNADKIDGAEPRVFLTPNELPYLKSDGRVALGVGSGQVSTRLFAHRGFEVDAVCDHDPSFARVVVRNYSDGWSYGDLDSAQGDVPSGTVEVVRDETIGDGPVFGSFQAMSRPDGAVIGGQVLAELRPPSEGLTRCEFSGIGLGGPPPE